MTRVSPLTGIHAAAEGLDEALERLGAEVAADELLDGLLLALLLERPDADGAQPRADLPRPRQEPPQIQGLTQLPFSA